MSTVDAGPAWRVAGQCSFTYRVVAEALAHHVPLRTVVTFLPDDEDPFPGLEGNSPWMREHRIHYGGWRECLRALAAAHRFELIAGGAVDDVAGDDVLVVAGLANKIPSAILARFGVAALNVHPSLLPDLRGPQPEAQAILNDYGTTGLTIHTMTDRFDAGPIRFQESYLVRDATVGELETIGATVAGRGLRALAELPPDDWPTLEPHGASRYCRAYDPPTLELREDLYIADARRRLRLRPEGYAYRDVRGARVFPVRTSSDLCRESTRLDFADGTLFVHEWVERADDLVTRRQCSCP